MQKLAYRVTGFTAVVSAAGFLLRWLQNMRIIDTETGLAVPHMGINTVVIALMVAVAAVLLGGCLWLRRYTSPTEPEQALAGRTFLYTVVGFVPVVLLFASGVIQLFQANEEVWTDGSVVLHRICAIATVAASFGLGVVIAGASKADRATARRVGSAILILADCLWLITVYKSAAADPVLWRYAVEILAIAAATVAVYYVAGYYFEEPHPKTALFFCELGAFFCFMCAMDEHTLADGVALVAHGVLLLTWGFAILQNQTVAPEPEPNQTGAEADQPEE
jgi:hypothetical protein